MVLNLKFPAPVRRATEWICQHPVRAGAMAGWFQQAASVGTGLLIVPLILHLFPLPESGLWFGFQGMVSMVGLVDFGIGAVVARQAAHIQGGGSAAAGTDFIDLGSGSEALRSLSDHAAWIYRLLACLLVVAGAVIFEGVVPRTRFLEGVTIDPRPLWYLMLLVPLSLLLANRSVSLLVGTGHLFTARLMLGLFFVFQGAGVALAAWLTRDLVVMAAVSCAVALSYAGVLRLLGRRLLPEVSRAKPVTVDLGQIRRILKVAVPMGVMSVSAFLVISIQVPLLAALLGPAVVAPFYLAQRIGQAGMTAVLQMFQPQLPRFTRMISAKESAHAWSVLRRNLFVGYPAVVFAAATFVVVSPWIAAVLAKGKEFPSQTTLVLMGLDYAICTCAVIGNQFVIASGRNPFAVPTLLAGLLNVAILVALVPSYGIAGVPLASLAAGIIASYWYSIAQLMRLHRELVPDRLATISP